MVIDIDTIILVLVIVSCGFICYTIGRIVGYFQGRKFKEAKW